MSHNFTLLPKECRIGSLDLCNEREWQLIKIISIYHPYKICPLFKDRTGQDKTGQACSFQAYRKLNRTYGHLGNRGSQITVWMMDWGTSSCKGYHIRFNMSTILSIERQVPTNKGSILTHWMTVVCRTRGITWHKCSYEEKCTKWGGGGEKKLIFCAE